MGIQLQKMLSQQHSSYCSPCRVCMHMEGAKRCMLLLALTYIAKYYAQQNYNVFVTIQMAALDALLTNHELYFVSVFTGDVPH